MVCFCLHGVSGEPFVIQISHLLYECVTILTTFTAVTQIVTKQWIETKGRASEKECGKQWTKCENRHKKSKQINKKDA